MGRYRLPASLRRVLLACFCNQTLTQGQLCHILPSETFLEAYCTHATCNSPLLFQVAAVWWNDHLQTHPTGATNVQNISNMHLIRKRMTAVDILYCRNMLKPAVVKNNRSTKTYCCKNDPLETSLILMRGRPQQFSLFLHFLVIFDLLQNWNKNKLLIKNT